MDASGSGGHETEVRGRSGVGSETAFVSTLESTSPREPKISSESSEGPVAAAGGFVETVEGPADGPASGWATQLSAIRSVSDEIVRD